VPGERAAPAVASIAGKPLPVETAVIVPCCGGSRESVDACRRERARLEANKVAATRLLQMFDNPVRARREYNRYVRDLNASIRMHNAVCKPYPIAPLSI